MKKTIVLLILGLLLVGCGGKGKEKNPDVFDKIESDLEKIEKAEDVMDDVNDKIKKMQDNIKALESNN